MHLSEQARADDLLERSQDVIETLPRLGTAGYWISDVRIYALQNRPELAIATLRQAIDEGGRILSWFYLNYDPHLDSIRDVPEFQRLKAKLEADLASQARRVPDLKASGALTPASSMQDQNQKSGKPDVRGPDSGRIRGAQNDTSRAAVLAPPSS
jgi:hypothetical protein